MNSQESGSTSLRFQDRCLLIYIASSEGRPNYNRYLGLSCNIRVLSSKSLLFLLQEDCSAIFRPDLRAWNRPHSGCYRYSSSSRMLKNFRYTPKTYLGFRLAQRTARCSE